MRKFNCRPQLEPLIILVCAESNIFHFCLIRPGSHGHFSCVSECDPSVASEDDFCQTISHDISLELSGEDDTEDSVTLFQAALNNAILNQQLQEELMRVNPDTPVRVTTGSGASPSDGDSDSGLTAGATAGIVVGALLFGLVPIVAFFVLRNRKPAEKDEAGEFKAFEGSNSDVQGDELAKADQSSVSDSLYTDAAIQLDDVAPPAFLGANQPDYGKKSSRRVIDELQAGQDVLAEPELDVAPDSSSNAGSSGWSSSAGISSLNTGSMDDSTDAAAAAGTSLAAIGATSALSRKLEAGRTQRRYDKTCGVILLFLECYFISFDVCIFQ
jgi:hypothetical protein